MPCQRIDYSDHRFCPVFGIALNRFLQKNPQSQLLTIIVDLNKVVLTIIRYVMIFSAHRDLCADCFNDQFFGVTDHFTSRKVSSNLWVSHTDVSCLMDCCFDDLLPRESMALDPKYEKI